MAEKADLFLDKGSDFTTTLDVVNASDASVNMAAYSISSVIKATHTNSQINSTSTSNLEFTATGYSNGSVILNLTDTQTGRLQAPKRYLYDVKVTTGSTTTKILEGFVHVNASTS